MRRSGWTFAVVLVVVVALVVVQLVRTPPAQSVSASEPASLDVAGSPSLSWPASAEGALEVSGVVRTSGRQVARPIASLAKMMTAYILLHDHPLTAGESGPSITVNPTDVAVYDLDAASSGSVLAVTAGEVLTEQQALQALLVASADNIAEMLAQWDAGSITAFVAKMNTTAKSLGMTHTTYTDPSGLEDTTVSSARDQLVMAMRAMALPAFASIVAMPEVTFPVGGTVQNYDYDIGHDGVIGIKTGSDSEALGCWAFAATRTVAGTARTVYGVIWASQALPWDWSSRPSRPGWRWPTPCQRPCRRCRSSLPVPWSATSMHPGVMARFPSRWCGPSAGWPRPGAG